MPSARIKDAANVPSSLALGLGFQTSHFYPFAGSARWVPLIFNPKQSDAGSCLQLSTVLLYNVSTRFSVSSHDSALANVVCKSNGNISNDVILFRRFFMGLLPCGWNR